VAQCLNQLRHRVTSDEQIKLEFNWQLHWDCLRQQWQAFVSTLR
jgi:hypothetical protein